LRPDAPDPIRVVLADDHAPTRAGIRAALEGRGFAIAAEVSSGDGAVEAALRERPDLCLLDIQMPGGGIQAAAEIGLALPDTAIVMLTVSTAEDDLFAALRAGARGYLLKDTDAERLPFALRAVVSGETAIPRTLVTRVIDEFTRRERPQRPRRLEREGIRLSEREGDVLGLLEEGLDTAEIGERLSISAVTVRRHVQSILKKLRVPDREAAVRLLAEQRLP
jgi:DNA-binding NarL/FixJ family response regulator